MTSETETSECLLSVQNLTIRFATEQGFVNALRGISFDVARHATTALVGESGCGKSVTAHSIMRILPTPPAEICAGKIVLDGDDLLQFKERKMRHIRGARMAIVFQDPLSALNPVYSIGAQLAEAYRIHERVGRKRSKERSIDLLERVGFPEPNKRFGDYPHELSGGMRQRVVIAMALACDPELLIADEPTTALDMVAAAQIGALLDELKSERQMSMLFISHDLSSVAERADHIVVLYAGQVVEDGPTNIVLETPQHPYTRALLRCVPPIVQKRRSRQSNRFRLPTIPRPAPDKRIETPAGCRFAPRCDKVFDRCQTHEPSLFEGRDGVKTRCFLAEPDSIHPGGDDS